MSVAFVQGKFGFTDSGTLSQAVTFTSNVGAGNTIVAFVKAAAWTSVSVTDNQGNTYTQQDVVAGGSGGANKVASFVAPNVTGGSVTVTATITGGAGFPRLLALEYSGADTSAPVNAHEATSQSPTVGSGSDAITSAGAASTSVANCMLVGFSVHHNNGTSENPNVGTSFTQRTVGSTPSNNFDFALSEDRILSSAGSAHATFSPSSPPGSGDYYTTLLVALQPPQGVASAIDCTDSGDSAALTAILGDSIVVVDGNDSAAILLAAIEPVSIAATDGHDSAAVQAAPPTLLLKMAPFFSTDTITTPGFRIYHEKNGSLMADGAHNTDSVEAIPNVDNGYCVALNASLLTLDSDGGYRGLIVWDSGGGSPFYVADELYIPPSAGASVTDKDGYTLSPAGVLAIWNALTSALSTNGSIGKRIADNLTGDAFARLGAPAGASIAADIATRLPSSSYVAPLDAANTRAAVGLASANLDTQLGAIGTAAVSAATDAASLEARVPANPADVSDVPTAAQNADKLLGRTIAGGADGGRMVKDALRPLRNKTSISGGVLTVKEEDDSTTAWTADVTTAPGDPLIEVDPA